MLTTPVGRLRLIGLFEGASFLLLLGVAMPLKYMAGYPEAVSVVGMAHGVLFMIYCLAIILAIPTPGWTHGWTLASFVAAVLPFGPFVLDTKLKKQFAETPGAEPSPQ